MQHWFITMGKIYTLVISSCVGNCWRLQECKDPGIWSILLVSTIAITTTSCICAEWNIFLKNRTYAVLISNKYYIRRSFTIYMENSFSKLFWALSTSVTTVSSIARRFSHVNLTLVNTFLNIDYFNILVPDVSSKVTQTVGLLKYV